MTKKLALILSLALIISALPNVSSALEADIDPNPNANRCTALTSAALRYQSRDSITSGEVSTLQAFLQSKGHLSSEPTGYFGLLTLAAVKDFQQKNSIEPTGYVGPITKAKINSISGCTGSSKAAGISDDYRATPIGSLSKPEPRGDNSLVKPVNTYRPYTYTGTPSENSQRNSRPSSDTKISARLINSSKPYAGVWGQFDVYNDPNVPARENWNWELSIKSDKDVKKTIYSIVVEHEGSNQRWSTIDSENWPLVVRLGGKTVNSSYSPLGIDLGDDEKNTLRLYGAIDNDKQSGTLISVVYSDGTYSQAKITGKTPERIEDSSSAVGAQPKISIITPGKGTEIDVFNSRSIDVLWKSSNFSDDFKLTTFRLRNLETGNEYYLGTNVLNDGRETFTIPKEITNDINNAKFTLEIKTLVPGRNDAMVVSSYPFIITSSIPRKLPATQDTIYKSTIDRDTSI